MTHRHPFDQPEAEQELADGYHIEYAGMKWGMFFVGEYVGGGSDLRADRDPVLRRLARPLRYPDRNPVFLVRWKTAFFIMIFILVRASIPRPRYDQVMTFGWMFCLPLTLLNLLVTGAMVLLAAPSAVQ